MVLAEIKKGKVSSNVLKPKPHFLSSAVHLALNKHLLHTGHHTVFIELFSRKGSERERQLHIHIQPTK